MNRAEIRPTVNTPYVILDPEGLIELKGRLIIRDPSEIFNAINSWIAEYFKDPGLETSVSFELEYINSAGTKSLLDMVEMLRLNCKDRKLNVKWFYEKPDEDIFDKGSFISSITGLKFEFHEI